MRIYPAIYVMLLVGLCLHAVISLFQSTPALAAMGLLLSCLAPLAFMVRIRYSGPARQEEHPVMISIISGFGAVMTMVAVERFGDQYQTFVLSSAAALAGWLVYVRWFLRMTKMPRR